MDPNTTTNQTPNQTNSNPVPDPATGPTPTPTPVTPPPMKTQTMIPGSGDSLPRPQNWLPWIIGAAILGLIIIVFIGISVGIAIIRSAFQYTPPPPATPPAPEVTIKPAGGKYASDSGVLKLRDDLKTIRQAIDSIDLIEPQIAPPALDLNINIKNAQ